jgi:phage baseplate assembly protein gpV
MARKSNDDDIDDLESIMRIGTVIKVKKSERKAQVRFEEFDNMKSGWLDILYQDTPWLPDVKDTVMCLYMPQSDGDGYIIGRL